MKYNQKLPKKVEKELDAYIKRIEKINWFQLSPDFKKSETNKQIKIALDAFGIKAKIEYRTLKTEQDWYAARDAARGAAWGAAWDAAGNAAGNAAWGAADVLALNTEEYKKIYPTGNFIHLIPLWEKGLYPCGVIDGVFIVYVPDNK